MEGWLAGWMAGWLDCRIDECASCWWYSRTDASCFFQKLLLIALGRVVGLNVPAVGLPALPLPCPSSTCNANAEG